MIVGRTEADSLFLDRTPYHQMIAERMEADCYFLQMIVGRTEADSLFLDRTPYHQMIVERMEADCYFLDVPLLAAGTSQGNPGQLLHPTEPILYWFCFERYGHTYIQC